MAVEYIYLNFICGWSPFVDFTFGDVVWIIEHSDYPYQTDEDYLKRREEKNDALPLHLEQPVWHRANGLPDAA